MRAAALSTPIVPTIVAMVVGCSVGTEPEQKTKANTPAPVVKANAEAPVTPPLAKETPPPAPKAQLQPAFKPYANKWLIILSSEKKRGAEPPSLAIIKEKVKDAQVARIDSSQFKALMPCYEVVIAKAFTNKKKAIAYSKQLSKLGVDNYPKNAGAFVGVQKRVQAYCQGARTTENACERGLRFVSSIKGKAYVHLGLDPIIVEKALAKAPKPVKWQNSVWASKLSTKALGDYALGHRFAVAAESGEQTTCAISEFVALTRGEPHFSYEGSRKPTCGEPDVYAKLDCEGGVTRGVAGPLDTLTGFSKAKASDAERDAAFVALKKNAAAYDKAKRAATAVAKSQNEKLKEAVTAHQFVAGSRKITVVTTHLTTRDGNDMCGAEDVNVKLVGAVEAQNVVRPLSEVTGDLIQILARDDKVLTVDHAWPDVTVLHTPSGECSLTVDFCDCPC